MTKESNTLNNKLKEQFDHTVQWNVEMFYFPSLVFHLFKVLFLIDFTKQKHVMINKDNDFGLTKICKIIYI